MKKVLLILFVVFTTSTLSSQNYKFGEVSKEELQEKVYPLDSSANAAILYKERKTSFEYVPNEGFNVITQVFLRLKIYNKEGFDWATNKISYYNSSNGREKISGLKAITYNLEKNKIVETKLNRKDVFDEELNKYWSQQKFTMPNIKEGSVIEWRYKLISPFKRIDDVQFQYGIPVKKMNASVEIPEYFIYKKQFKGYYPVFAKTETKSRSINFTEKERDVRDINSRATFSNVKIDLLSNLETYEVSNVPALIEEAYVNNIENYKTAIQYEYSELHWPRQPIKYYSHSWEDVTKTIYNNYNFGSEIYKSNHYSDDLAVILAAAKTDSEKIIGIFELVKQKVKWNKYNGITKFNGTRQAYKEAVGNVFDINLNLVSMLNKAGLKANPVILSTRAHGISFFPTIDGFNYVIAAVELPEGLVLLDATEQYSTPNILPFRTLNGEGRLIRDDGSSETVSLNPVKPAGIVTVLKVEIDEEGTIEGQNRTNYLNHQALSYREKYAAIDNDDIVVKLEEKKGGLEISDFELSGKKETYKPVMETYKFYSENSIDVVGDKIFFKPLFFEATTTSPFKLKKREYPINFGTTSSSKTLVNITIPEGYVIESVPESINVKLPNNYGSYRYHISTSGNVINVNSQFKINTINYPVVNYDEMKEFYKMIIAKNLEQVVLKKES
ncbi:transglutaminase [uncultured Lutibacter sp.]|uniref:transglutaminase n=1 Tax=uncultured Lutibacter sp. TaxID=437739 RepID=UPI0026260154|nr:transglutaminase [uncultured Lutibacter sp.]